MRRQLPESYKYYQFEELSQALAGADALVSGVSSFGVDWFLQTVLPILPEDLPVLAVTKGMIEENGRLIPYPLYYKRQLGSLRRNLNAVGGPCTSYELADRDQTYVAFCGEDAETLENAGVWSVYIYAVNEEDGTKQEVRVFTNKMVDASKLLPYTNEDLGLGERVQLDVLLEVIAASGTEDKDALRRALAARRDELIPKHITVDDIFASVNYLLALSHGIGKTDDIDHLGNRRLRSVGELLLNQLRIGFSRMDKIVKEKMTTQDIETVTPQSLINIRPIVSAIRDFFGSSPLSQFMDQTNPLSELTHKRRLSALGPGGLSRDRASFEVRDVITRITAVCAPSRRRKVRTSV